MAAKSAISDVSRVQNIPLAIANKIKSLVPERGFDVSQVVAVEGKEPAKMPKVNLKNCYKYVPDLRKLINGQDSADIQLSDQANNVASMLTYAQELEDTNRQVGIHACGVIIGADDLTKFAPICTIKDKKLNKDVVVTQYDGHVVESVGLIKMDFLGLSTLTLIKEALSNIKKTHGIDIDIDNIPIDDKRTYELYGSGHTIGTFQFESEGMQKYLCELKPTQLTDLIAMNALYRPGPMDYIKTFIDRKLGKEPIVYDIPVMEKYLKDTYGVTVYQEQVMLLSQLLANFTKGEADTLRKAMGKKNFAMLAILKPKFMEGGKKNGHDPKVLEKIWSDWEKFASYAFNKSHAACYAWVAYQTGYLKAHYPAEFMAANLTQNSSDIKKVKKFMEECKAMKINVKGPDINESELNFTVNKKGEIRFGLGGIKGVGTGAVDAIVREREKNGRYKDVFNFVERVSLTACNSKTIQSLAIAGAFDNLGIRREQILAEMPGNIKFLDALMRYGNNYQSDKEQNTNTLFGTMSDVVSIQRPTPPDVPDMPMLEKLNLEKECVGMYLSAHPLDPFRFDLEHFCNISPRDLNNINNLQNREVTFGGLVTDIREGISKSEKPYKIFTIEDFLGSGEVALFGKEYESYSRMVVKNEKLYIRGKIAESRFPDKDGKRPFKLQIEGINMLSNIRERLIKKLSIDMDLKMVNETTVEMLRKAFSTKGSVNLSFMLIDAENGLTLNLMSRNTSIDMNDEVIQFLLENQNIMEYRLNDGKIKRRKVEERTEQADEKEEDTKMPNDEPEID